MSPVKVVLLSIGAVVAYDAIASVASLAFALPYAAAGVGSALIYAATGFFAARAKNRWFSVMAGAIAGLSDATFGWCISWAVGPGRVPDGTFTVSRWLIAAVSVVLVAVVCAAIGGIAAGFMRSQKPDAA